VISVWYIVVFAGLAILLVAAVLIRNARVEGGGGRSGAPTGSANGSRTPRGSAARQERKCRRAQSRNDRRKRH
jgi:preprotein translocase subunit SecG